MPRSTIVQDYKFAEKGQSQTMTLDDALLASILTNDIKRPKGYTVSYHTNPEVERHHFGQSHPMKPWRLTLTNKIVMAYGMHTAMDNYVSRAATKEELMMFHTQGYIEALEQVTPYNMNLANYTYSAEDFPPWGFGDDCPIFDGMYRYCALYTGASMDAAQRLTSGQSQIAINWSGGLHHAKKSAASGFCYVNDIVNAILHLLLYHPRVLYIDIDVHHGDGVEQAFWSTDRVMTLSFHKYDKLEFFPGEDYEAAEFRRCFPRTGPLESTGPESLENAGAHHSMNVPLNDGIEDTQYERTFKDIVGRCVETYRPTAIVLQCGADSLGGDRLGVFNLNIKAHGACVEFTKSLGLPLLILGGGGYTPRNVSRLWAYETAVAIGAKDVSPNLPAHTPFLNHFAPDRSLFPPLSEFKRYENKNTNKYLAGLVEGITESLRYLKGAPSVQMRYIPPGLDRIRDDVEREIKEEKADLDQNRRAREAGLGVHGELYRD